MVWCVPVSFSYYSLHVALTIPSVTRNRIPDNVYESWNTQPVVAGSDSEHDDCSDVLLSDVDSLNDSFSSKSDNELASSLMELELTDAEVEDPKGKGKMKVVSPKRTNSEFSVLALMRVLIRSNSETNSHSSFP